MSTYPNDTVLFQAFQQGQSDAVETIFGRYFKPVYIYAERITGESLGTEDIVVDSFQKSWERRATFPTIDDFRIFLYRIVRNACLTSNLTRSKHAGAHAQLHFLTARDSEEDNADSREIMRAELMQAIYQEIEELPDRCRTIFKLIFLQGLSTDQIAAQLDLNTQTVRTQKARAIGLIRTRLLKKGMVPALLLLYSLLEKI